jgi:hypothetical protein
MARGQASITAVEAALGILLLFGVTLTFVLGAAGPADNSAQLDAYANDAITILATEEPGHTGATRLAELTASAASFDRERAAVRQRLERLLPPNVFFRVETAHGVVGHRLPEGVPTGVATVPTRSGTVTLRVWYV